METPDDFSPIAYIAQSLCAKDCDQLGVLTTRWCYLDAARKQQYLARAEQLYQTWRENELAEVQRLSRV